MTLLSFAWTRSPRILLPRGSETYADDYSIFYNPMGDAVFGFGTLQIIVNILSLFAPIAFLSVNRGVYIASNGSSADTIANFNSEYLTYFLILGIFDVILIAVLAVAVHATYNTSVTSKTFRIFGNIYNLLWVSLSAWGAWLAIDALPLVEYEKIKAYLSSGELYGAFGVLVGFGLFSIVTYIAIAAKKRQFHVTVGTLLIIMIVVLTGLNVAYTKSAQAIRLNLNKDCQNSLYDFPETVLTTLGCVKYVHTADNALDTTCSSDDATKASFVFDWDAKV